VRRLNRYLWPLRSGVTWGKSGSHSGYRHVADKDEVPGSSPGRPTTGIDRYKRCSSCLELVGLAGYRINNSYLVTVAGHDLLLWVSAQARLSLNRPRLRALDGVLAGREPFGTRRRCTLVIRRGGVLTLG
jgi:hypothetical protein